METARAVASIVRSQQTTTFAPESSRMYAISGAVRWLLTGVR